MRRDVESHPISSVLSVCKISNYQSAPRRNPENPLHRNNLEKINVLLPSLSIDY